MTNSRTRGTVVGVGRTGIRHGRFTVGGGVYKGSTTGITQTALSHQASPPQMPTGLLVFVGIIFAAMGVLALTSLANEEYITAIFRGSVAGIFLVALITFSSRAKKRYDHALYEYSNTRVCQRCGTFYLGIPRTILDLEPFRNSPLAVLLFVCALLLVGSVAVIAVRKPEIAAKSAETSTAIPSPYQQLAETPLTQEPASPDPAPSDTALSAPSELSRGDEKSSQQTEVPPPSLLDV